MTLRAIDPARDAADYQEWNQEPNMTRWVGNIAPATVAESQQELERLAALPDKTQWAIVNNADGRMIGRFFVVLEGHEGALVAGEGNRMAKPYWRRGHNRDARRLVFEYVFGTLKADVYETHCWRDNVNSRQSILAHGFRPVGERPELNPKCGEMWVRCFFQMTRREWQERAAHEKGEPGETR